MLHVDTASCNVNPEFGNNQDLRFLRFEKRFYPPKFQDF